MLFLSALSAAFSAFFPLFDSRTELVVSVESVCVEVLVDGLAAVEDEEVLLLVDVEGVELLPLLLLDAVDVGLADEELVADEVVALGEALVVDGLALTVGVVVAFGVMLAEAVALGEAEAIGDALIVALGEVEAIGDAVAFADAP